MVMYEAAILGLLGGVARAAVGLLKAQRHGVKVVW